MKTIHQLTLLLALGLGLGTASTFATPYTFQYTFSDNSVVSGSLDGTVDLVNSALIDVASVSAVYFNGSAMSQLDPSTPLPVFTATYDQGSASYLPGAVISFDASQNNFFLANGDVAGGAFTSLFYMTNAADFAGLAVGEFDPGSASALQDPEIVSGNWQLAAASVPEGGATFALLAGAIVALGLARRKLARV